MGRSEKKKDPAFIEDVYRLNEGTELYEAPKLSIQAINVIDLEGFKRIGL